MNGSGQITVAPLADQLDALLPQTQCTRCGYPDCRSYAGALAEGVANPNQCPPGGEETAIALAALLNRPPQALDPAFGTMPAQAEVARVIEADCIGCFKCVTACPVDAIIGAPKWMHTVIASDCTGCELCLPVCPTDCIVMVPRAPTLPAPLTLATRWRGRYVARTQRLAHERDARASPSAPPHAGTLASTHPSAPAREAHAEHAAIDSPVGSIPTTDLQSRARELDIGAAIARARARRGDSEPQT